MGTVRAILVSRLVSMAVAVGMLLVGWIVTAGQPVGHPLVLIEQGVTAMRFGTEVVDGETVPKDVFVIRDGSVIRIFSKRTPGTGSLLVYCPKERFFVSPEDTSLFDREGRYVEGPATGDMAEYKKTIDTEELELTVGDRVDRERSNGEISGEAAQAYLEWKADPATPRAFCQDPVR